MLDDERQQHRIRLSGIDAPEKAQPYGQRSKENLSRLVFKKEVRVEWQKRDRYGRILGKVMVQPSDCPTCPPEFDTFPEFSVEILTEGVWKQWDSWQGDLFV